MTRADKQQLVRYLDERGAFALRKAVESVAETLGVSRFTVYNYLDAARGGLKGHPARAQRPPGDEQTSPDRSAR